MKTLSGTFTFVVLVVIAIVAVFTFYAFAQPEHVAAKKFFLKIGRSAEDYVDLRDKKAFDTALNALKDHGGQYEIRFKPDRGNVIDHYHPVSIKTDKVTTSEVAQSARAGESAANDPNVTNHLSADSATDIKSVLDAFP
jgi:uncharacterized protein YxeA